MGWSDKSELFAVRRVQFELMEFKWTLNAHSAHPYL